MTAMVEWPVRALSSRTSCRVAVGARLESEIDVVEPLGELKQLPCARGLWKPQPDLKTSAECWLRSDVHFVHSNVLDGLWINTSIEKIGNVSVPQLMRGCIKVQRVSDFGLIFLGHAQRWGNRVFDALPIHVLIIVPGLSGADNDILPHSLKLQSSQRLPFAVSNHII